MRKGLYKILLIISVLGIVCCAAGTALAAPSRWFGSAGLENDSTAVGSWIRVTVTGADGFDSDEDYTAEFTVKQWAENGSYKLVLTGIDFFSPSQTGSPDPDEMWEYYTGQDWAPVSEAENMELIPVVTVNTDTAYFKLRVKPGFFEKTDFMDYLEYHLELTAELLPI